MDVISLEKGKESKSRSRFKPDLMRDGLQFQFLRTKAFLTTMRSYVIQIGLMPYSKRPYILRLIKPAILQIYSGSPATKKLKFHFCPVDVLSFENFFKTWLIDGSTDQVHLRLTLPSAFTQETDSGSKSKILFEKLRQLSLVVTFHFL